MATEGIVSGQTWRHHPQDHGLHSITLTHIHPSLPHGHHSLLPRAPSLCNPTHLYTLLSLEAGIPRTPFISTPPKHVHVEDSDFDELDPSVVIPPKELNNLQSHPLVVQSLLDAHEPPGPSSVEG